MLTTTMEESVFMGTLCRLDDVTRLGFNRIEKRVRFPMNTDGDIFFRNFVDLNFCKQVRL